MKEHHFYVFLATLVAIGGISGLIWFLAKVLAKLGRILIPIACAVVATYLWPERPPSGLGMTVLFASTSLIAIVGIMGTLACHLYASIFDLERGVQQLKSENKASS